MTRPERWYDDPAIAAVLDGPEDTYMADLTAANDRRFAADRERWDGVQAALDDARDDLVTIDHEAMDAYLAGLDNDPLYGAEE